MNIASWHVHDGAICESEIDSYEYKNKKYHRIFAILVLNSKIKNNYCIKFNKFMDGFLPFLLL